MTLLGLEFRDRQSWNYSFANDKIFLHLGNFYLVFGLLLLLDYMQTTFIFICMPIFLFCNQLLHLLNLLTVAFVYLSKVIVFFQVLLYLFGAVTAGRVD